MDLCQICPPAYTQLQLCLQTYCYAVLDVAAKIGFGAVIIGSNNRLMESYGIGRRVLPC